jgi:thiol:disulfide interchange protein
MKINITKIGVALLAVGICIWSAQVRAQTTTTVTTTKGAFTEYVPGSETVVMRTETNPAPSRYVVTKQTKIVDESGASVAIERISAGSPLAVEYTGTGERLIASRIVVQRPAAVAAPVTTAPVTTQDTATTTTTTRPLTHDEKHDLKEQREHRKEALKEEIEKKKDALEEAKDKLDDDH